VHIPAFAIPLSSFMSEEAKRAFIQRPFGAFVSVNWDKLSLDQQREAVDNWARPMMERAKAVYHVNIQERKIGGVQTVVIEPTEGVSPDNRNRVLISLHGGGYSYASGAKGGLQLGAVPVAGYGKIKVVSVDYRLSPNYRFPAATEDVVAVYRELLRTYPPQNIGIYGCSTGATLAAGVVAWLQREKLPRPGAIGLLCDGAVKDDEVTGDAYYVASALMGDKVPDKRSPPEPYMEGTDPKDPLVAPVVSLEVLAKFPPTLLIAGTRDVGLSEVVYTHTRLAKAGVDADLHVWDGMWHNFFFDVDLPESKDAYDVITRFFEKHLGQDDRLK